MTLEFLHGMSVAALMLLLGWSIADAHGLPTRKWLLVSGLALLGIELYVFSNHPGDASAILSNTALLFLVFVALYKMHLLKQPKKVADK